jgi:hypothetical protein
LRPDHVPHNIITTHNYGVNTAVTDFALSIVTLQVVLVPLAAPLQPAKRELALGVAVRVTIVPLVKVALQEELQLIPDGEDVTEPPPPALFTVTESVVV